MTMVLRFGFTLMNRWRGPERGGLFQMFLYATAPTQEAMDSSNANSTNGKLLLLAGSLGQAGKEFVLFI